MATIVASSQSIRFRELANFFVIQKKTLPQFSTIRIINVDLAYSSSIAYQKQQMDNLDDFLHIPLYINWCKIHVSMKIL